MLRDSQEARKCEKIRVHFCLGATEIYSSEDHIAVVRKENGVLRQSRSLLVHRNILHHKMGETQRSLNEMK